MARKSEWNATFADGTTVAVLATSKRMAKAKAMVKARQTQTVQHLQRAGLTRDERRRNNEGQFRVSSLFDLNW